MAISSKASGNQSLTLSTPVTLLSTTDPGVYQLWINLANAANGDEFVIAFLGKANASDSETQIQAWTLANAQTSPLRFFPAIASVAEYKVTLTQVAGTGRSVQWGVTQIQ
jgi:hypothetical protein